VSETARVSAALARLLTEGGEGNRLVVTQGGAWFVVHAAPGSPLWRVEAAPRSHLPSGLRFGLEEVARLRAAGFANVAGRKPLAWSATVVTDGPEALAAKLLQWLPEVYGVPGDAPVELDARHGPALAPDNAPLADAMRACARDREMATRQALYRQLVRGTFLLPVDGGAPRVVGDLAGWPIFAVFTDHASYADWDPRLPAVDLMPGRALWGRLLAAGVGSVLINPGGRLGGELYRHEVESLALAVRGVAGLGAVR
jgi:hypothetical protein